jgi:hypothetical protein
LEGHFTTLPVAQPMQHRMVGSLMNWKAISWHFPGVTQQNHDSNRTPPEYEYAVLFEILIAAGLCLLFLARFFLRSWRWRRHVPSKRRFTFNGLQGVISQKTGPFRSIQHDRWASLLVLAIETQIYSYFH